MKISAVVFDYGGVMTTSTMPLRVIDLAREKNIPWDAIQRGFAAHRLDYDGNFITLHEMYEAIWSDAGLNVDEETTRLFMDADNASWLYRRERTLGWMRELKLEGFKIGILTNINSTFADMHFKRAFADYIALADAMVISGEERMYKPMPEIYALMQKRIGVEAREICFIDDSEKNVSGAEACGWHAIRFESCDQTEREFKRMLSSAE